MQYATQARGDSRNAYPCADHPDRRRDDLARRGCAGDNSSASADITGDPGSNADAATAAHRGADTYRAAANVDEHVFTDCHSYGHPHGYCHAPS